MIAEIAFSLVLTAVTAPVQNESAGKYCNTDQKGFCKDSVVNFSLNRRMKTPRIRVNCALGEVLIVQLPEGEKILGDPAVGNAALFKFKLQEKPLQLLLWPTIPKGSKVTSTGLDGETTNVQIQLASGINVILGLQIAQPEVAVQRLVLQFPELADETAAKKKLRDQIREEVEREFKDREDSMDSEAHDLALRITARDISKRINCTDLHEREMRDLLVVRAQRICQIGEHVYIKMSIHNRSRTLFSLQSIEILSVDGKEMQPLEALVEWEDGERPQLRFDQKKYGVAVFPVTEDSAAAEYAVKVTENSGKKRVVTLDGIEF